MAVFIKLIIVALIIFLIIIIFLFIFLKRNFVIKSILVLIYIFFVLVFINNIKKKPYLKDRNIVVSEILKLDENLIDSIIICDSVFYKGDSLLKPLFSNIKNSTFLFRDNIPSFTKKRIDMMFFFNNNKVEILYYTKSNNGEFLSMTMYPGPYIGDLVLKENIEDVISGIMLQDSLRKIP